MILYIFLLSCLILFFSMEFLISGVEMGEGTYKRDSNE